MRLVADEGVDKAIIDALRAAGFSVTYFAEAGSGSSDQEILAAANQSQTLLLTCDKDFGELVYRQRLATAGVVLIRLDGLSAEAKARIVQATMTAHVSELDDAFAVISPGLLRIRHRTLVSR
jgi:predicted nuclease of predicted toxin-antitoxin system